MRSVPAGFRIVTCAVPQTTIASATFGAFTESAAKFLHAGLIKTLWVQQGSPIDFCQREGEPKASFSHASGKVYMGKSPLYNCEI